MSLLLVGCSAGRPGFIDMATLERPTSPNTYLVCPGERTAASVDREPPIYAVEPERLWQHWLTALADEPRLVEVARDDAARRYLAVQRTPVLRFPDVIQLEVYPAAEGSTLCLYSRSVYGYHDLGTNRARIEDWLERIGGPAAQ